MSLQDVLKEITDASESPTGQHDIAFILVCHYDSHLGAARNTTKQNASDFMMIASHYVYDFCIKRNDDEAFPEQKASIIHDILRKCHIKRQRNFTYTSDVEKRGHSDRCRAFEQRVKDFMESMPTDKYYFVMYETPYELQDENGMKWFENGSDRKPGLKELIDIINERF